MKNRVLIIFAGIIALLTGCIPSVNPFYEEKDVVFNTQLLGEWTKDNGTWKFEAGDNKGYKMTIDESSGKHGEMEAHLFKLKEELYLDLIPSKLDFATNTPDLISAAVFPGHLLVAVKELGPTLKVTFMDYDELKKFLDANPSAIAHRNQGDDETLLTASTRDLQKFIIKHGTNFFSGTLDEWTRKSAAVPQK